MIKKKKSLTTRKRFNTNHARSRGDLSRFADIQLERLLVQMEMSGIEQDSRSFKFEDGSKVSVFHSYGVSYVDINVPDQIIITPSAEEEEGKLESSVFLIKNRIPDHTSTLSWVQFCGSEDEAHDKWLTLLGEERVTAYAGKVVVWERDPVLEPNIYLDTTSLYGGGGHPVVQNCEVFEIPVTPLKDHLTAYQNMTWTDEEIEAENPYKESLRAIYRSSGYGYNIISIPAIIDVERLDMTLWHFGNEAEEYEGHFDDEYEECGFTIWGDQLNKIHDGLFMVGPSIISASYAATTSHNLFVYKKYINLDGDWEIFLSVDISGGYPKREENYICNGEEQQVDDRPPRFKDFKCHVIDETSPYDSVIDFRGRISNYEAVFLPLSSCMVNYNVDNEEITYTSQVLLNADENDDTVGMVIMNADIKFTLGDYNIIDLDAISWDMEMQPGNEALLNTYSPVIKNTFGGHDKWDAFPLVTGSGTRDQYYNSDGASWTMESVTKYIGSLDYPAVRYSFGNFTRKREDSSREVLVSDEQDIKTVELELCRVLPNAILFLGTTSIDRSYFYTKAKQCGSGQDFLATPALDIDSVPDQYKAPTPPAETRNVYSTACAYVHHVYCDGGDPAGNTWNVEDERACNGLGCDGEMCGGSWAEGDPDNYLNDSPEGSDQSWKVFEVGFPSIGASPKGFKRDNYTFIDQGEGLAPDQYFRDSVLTYQVEQEGPHQGYRFGIPSQVKPEMGDPETFSTWVNQLLCQTFKNIDAETGADVYLLYFRTFDRIWDGTEWDVPDGNTPHAGPIEQAYLYVDGVNHYRDALQAMKVLYPATGNPPETTDNDYLAHLMMV